MRRERTTPSFEGLRPASERASAVARGASTKTNTHCEQVLRRELWRRGLRYRLHHPGLPGCPDIVFVKQRVVVFSQHIGWRRCRRTSSVIAARPERLRHRAGSSCASGRRIFYPGQATSPTRSLLPCKGTPPHRPRPAHRSFRAPIRALDTTQKHRQAGRMRGG